MARLSIVTTRFFRRLLKERLIVHLSRQFLFATQTSHDAALGLVSPGAVTDGVTPIFFRKKTDDLF